MAAESKETFGTRLKEVRTERGLSQEELAKAANVSQSTVAGIETGKYTNSKHAVALAQVLGVSPGWLITGIGDLSAAPSEASFEMAWLVKNQLRKIPLCEFDPLSTNGAGTGFDGAVIGFVYADASTTGHGSFAIEAQDDAMAPEVRKGDLLIFNKFEWSLPAPGGYVLARIDEGIVVLRRYRDRGVSADGKAQFELAPNNDDHASYQSLATWITFIGWLAEIRRKHPQPANYLTR